MRGLLAAAAGGGMRALLTAAGGGTRTLHAAALCTLLAAAAAASVAVEDPPPLMPLLRADQANMELSMIVDGGKLKVTFANGDYLDVVCGKGVTLDGALPRVANTTRVRRASVSCAPPRRGYAVALRRLGVELVADGALTLRLPADGTPLARDHLAGLTLVKLTLFASDNAHPPPAPRAGLLAGRALERLEVHHVQLPPDALAAPPRGLTALWLDEAGVRRVPAAALANLTLLHAASPLRLEGGAAALRKVSLTLAAGQEPPDWTLLPGVSDVSLTAWHGAAQPARWAACGSLRTLSLTLPGFTALPDGWLAACSALQSLQLQSAKRLRALPPAWLEGSCGAEGAGGPGLCPAPALTRLELRHGALEWLPERLFDPVPNLQYLDLSFNKLNTLPGGIFTKPIKLVTLNLSKNQFANDSVYFELGVLRHLSVLNLSSNRRLGDACTGDAEGRYSNGDSHLRALTNLTELNLSFTEVTRICRDWREGMPRLLNLRLSNTNITILSFSDLQYKRDNATLQHAEGPSVELYNARVTTIDYSAADELRARDVPTARVTVKLSVPLVCDCRLFRALRALRREPKHANLGGTLMCAARPDGAPARALLQVPLDDLMCRSEPKVCPDLPPGCACWHREQGEMGRLQWRVRVNCEGARLAEMPPLPALNGSDVEWDLRLARNNISTLDKLPSGLLKLDLRNNSVSRVSARAATALGRAVAVKLSGNPLACDCDAMPLLNAVAALHAGRGELDAALCEDGRALLDDGDGRFACPEGGGLSVLLVATLGTLLGALALATLAAGSALVRPAQRVRLKGVLLRWGWLPRSAEPADGRRFDVFVAFAHMDAEFVRELTVRLESGAHALRLCLHERDWAPGEFIGAQVAASVRNARRTLVVVSRHFLLSEWTRAEFREAQAAGARDGTPRLVVVLLEEPDALPLDRELRRYLATNTYLRSNHPRFWERLRDALAAPAPGPTTLAIPKPDPTTLTIPIPVTAAGSAPAHALSMGADKTPVGGSPCRNKPVGGLPCRNTPVGGSPGGLADGAHVAPTPA